MNGFLNKNLKSYAKNWLLPVKYAEMQLKNAVRNQYTNLYAYGANNPVHYIDPDGRELIIKGDQAFKQNVANYLSLLAPGASVDLKTGKVFFDENKCRGWHIKGSELIEKLVNNGATVIQQEKGNDKASKTISNEAGSVWVIFNPDFRRDIPTVLSNRDGKTLYVEIAKPIMILGHELIHALHYTEGTIDDSTVDFYINLFGVAGQTKNIKKEELRTVGIPGYYSTNDITENMLRSELSFLLRADYD